MNRWRRSALQVALRAYPAEFRWRFGSDIVATVEDADGGNGETTTAGAGRRRVGTFSNLVINGLRTRLARQRDLDPESRFGTVVLSLGTIALFWVLGGITLPTSGLSGWLQFWHWRRGPLLQNTTPAGGDMGAHVWTPDVIKREVLGRGSLLGWSDGWFAGMPVLQFYFPFRCWRSWC